ncbi:MAG: hypothetical protein ACLFUJ_04045 [Phycisphaerae bacterium]
MADFPRTQIEGLSVSRLLIGTNWFLGFSHTSKAQDEFIKARQSRQKIAEILEVFLAAGVDTIYGVRPESPHLEAAIEDAQQATGRGMIKMGTPHLDLSGTAEAESDNGRTLDAFAAIGCKVCLPHQATTDALLDKTTRTIRRMDRYAELIRQRGMIPGLSTHMPETIGYADQTGLDVGTYIQIYNPVGFLMQVEVDWVHRIIQSAKKPVINIKPLAAGRVLPLVGLAFSWATLRDQDMVCIGCLTPDEAREDIEISLSQLQRRASNIQLQRTRSKASLESAE